MKLRHVFFAMLATGLFAACNNDDIVVDNVEELTGAEGFITVKVALPSSTSPGTRDGQGGPNDNFDNGETDGSEWKVNDLTIIVLNGTGDDAKVEVVQKATPTWTSNTSANITVSSTKIGAIEVGSTPTRYVLVIANNSDKLDLSSVKTYGEINKVLTNVARDDFKTNGFFMSNAPIVVSETVEGTTTRSVQTLAPCIPQSTAVDAAKSPNFAIVYLERILGKVEVKSATGSDWDGWTYTVPTTGPTNGDKVAFTAWGLDVTNTTTYPVRQVVSDWIGYKDGGLGTATKVVSNNDYGKNRFIGAATDPQRIYWAIDPNYNKAGTFAKLDMKSTLSALNATTKNIDYCLENTFDVANQKQDRTTRVVMQAKYIPSDMAEGETDFFRSEGGIIYNKTKLNNYVASILGLDEVSEVHMQDPTQAIWRLQNFDTGEVTPWEYKDVEESCKETYVSRVKGKKNGNEVFITIKDNGYEEIFNSMGKFDYYKGGVCYYIARIKHFGDLLTPWDNSTDYTNGAEVNTYDKDYLGRYGVVRNNWYELTISKADKGPGEPVIPDTPETPDDEITYYIDAQINILSWAKRTQDVEW